MADTPEAAAPTTEATPINNTISTDATQTASSNGQTTTGQVSQTNNPSPTNDEQVAKYFGTDVETLGKFRKFVEANGQFDTVFEKVKSKISNPEKPVEKPAEPQTTQASQTTQPIQQNANIPEGAMSYNEILMRDHFKMLAEEEKYAGIKDEIVQGKVFSEMTDMGMKPFLENGMIDMKNILKFLDLKAKGAPAPQTSATPEASPAPTANYTPVGETISTREEALKVLQESAIAAQSGSAPHPAYEKAKAFLKEHPLGSK